jgi:hypothetical protein
MKFIGPDRVRIVATSNPDAGPGEWNEPTIDGTWGIGLYVIEPFPTLQLQAAIEKGPADPLLFKSVQLRHVLPSPVLYIFTLSDGSTFSTPAYV